MILIQVRYWWKTPNEAPLHFSSSSLRELASAELPPFSLGDVTANDVMAGDVNGNTCTEDGLEEIVQENKALKESLLEVRNPCYIRRFSKSLLHTNRHMTMLHRKYNYRNILTENTHI